jgi:hypothetical protein
LEIAETVFCSALICMFLDEAAFKKMFVKGIEKMAKKVFKKINRLRRLELHAALYIVRLQELIQTSKPTDRFKKPFVWLVPKSHFFKLLKTAAAATTTTTFRLRGWCGTTERLATSWSYQKFPLPTPHFLQEIDSRK